MENTEIIEKETTHSIWGVEDGEILVPVELKNRSDIDKGILFESSDDNEDGTYPLVMHYVTLVNNIDKNGVSVWLNKLSKPKESNYHLNINYGICRIIRESKYDSKATLIFNEPIEILLETIGDRKIIEKVSEIKGEFTYDWYWTKNGRQKKIANGFEIWFNIEKYLK
jgi:hypothetical protein